MDKKLIINFFYNIGYQILTLILPFITIPYVSRIFNPEQLGMYSSTLAMVQMFCIVGMFAVGSYGVKKIAESRDSDEALSVKFYEIRYMQKITVAIALVIYISVFVIFNSTNTRLMYLIQSIHLFASLVDISWLFMGIEDFKKTVTRNTIVKLGSLSLIFILVKKPEDLVIYTLILAISMFIGNLSMWIYVNKIILVKVKGNTNFKYNIIMASTLLLSQVSYQVYTSFDRTILGAVSTMEAVGMYDQSQKIIRMAAAIVTSLGAVMMPRIANMLSNNKSKEEINSILKKSLNLTLFISVGATFGIVAISENFVPWFYSAEYVDVITLLNLTSVVCVLTAIGGFLSNQYAIPKGNKKAYVYPIVTAAVISLVLNLILGKFMGALGACIAIISAEAVALVLRMYYLKDELNLKYLFSDLSKFLLSGIGMILSVLIIRNIFNLDSSIIATIIEVSTGGSIYLAIVLILNREYLDFVKTKISGLLK